MNSFSKFVSFFVILFCFLFCYDLNLFSCSEIFINPSKISARNFDLMYSDGIIRITPRGQKQESDYANPGEKKLSWISKYGSVSFLLRIPR